jgi:hypothetical protein
MVAILAHQKRTVSGGQKSIISMFSQSPESCRRLFPGILTLGKVAADLLRGFGEWEGLEIIISRFPDSPEGCRRLFPTFPGIRIPGTYYFQEF